MTAEFYNGVIAGMLISIPLLQFQRKQCEKLLDETEVKWKDLCTGLLAIALETKKENIKLDIKEKVKV